MRLKLINYLSIFLHQKYVFGKTFFNKNVNPFASVPMFLICVLESFKCFYKHPIRFFLPCYAYLIFACLTHTYGYL